MFAASRLAARSAAASISAADRLPKRVDYAAASRLKKIFHVNQQTVWLAGIQLSGCSDLKWSVYAFFYGGCELPASRAIHCHPIVRRRVQRAASILRRLH